jgi:hypothetical protein
MIGKIYEVLDGAKAVGEDEPGRWSGARGMCVEVGAFGRLTLEIGGMVNGREVLTAERVTFNAAGLAAVGY